MSLFFDNRTVLITGGTGSFGNAFTRWLLKTDVRAVRIFSRDEFKQGLMAQRLTDPRVRFLIGDVRDRDRLRRATEGADLVVHAAALKQVPSCEYNPLEAKKTNIDGAQNVIDSAIDCGVERVMALSTDKACAPYNLYGMTKAVAERLFVDGNFYAGLRPTRFSVVRYGNVVGSRGSVIPMLMEQAKAGKPFTLTDSRMTRFWITLGEAVRFIAARIEGMQGGELFVPCLPSTWLTDIAKAIDPDWPVEFIGVRPGEKLHEAMVSEQEAPDAQYCEDRASGLGRYIRIRRGGRGLDGPYTSGTNPHFLTVEQIRERLPDALSEAG